MAEKAATKLLGKKVANKPLEKQVKMAYKMMGMMSMPETRKRLLQDRGLPSDIRDMAKKGMSRYEIKDYYWGCEPFRKFWSDMEMQEATLDELIRGALEDKKAPGLLARLFKKRA